MKFNQDTILGQNDDCPNCGQDGYGHVTEFDENNRIGRHCLECGWTWPIELDKEPEYHKQIICPACGGTGLLITKIEV